MVPIQTTQLRTFLLLILLISSSCRVIPIQMVRVSQSEAYIQKFDVLEISTRDSGSDSEFLYAEQDKKIDEAFSKLLGTKNWQNVKDIFGLKEVRTKLLTGEITANGLLNILIYINPENHDEFFIEGNGRFFIINQSEGQIMLSGDFHIPTEKHKISELFDGQILISANLYTTRVPEQLTYINEANLKYCIKMDNSRAKKKQLLIDRRVEHEVYLMKDAIDDELDSSKLIGKMRFLDANQKSKVIDLGGMRFLRNDY